MHKLLIWKLVNNILPTCAKINSFFPISDTLYPLCDLEIEINDHLLLICSFTKQLWFTSKWCFRIALSNEHVASWITLILKNNGSLFSNDIDREELPVYLAVFFGSIWSNRNLIIHGSSLFEHFKDCLYQNIKQLDQSTYQTIKSALAIKDKWMKPSHGWYKVNWDYSFAHGNAIAASVVQNNNVSILYAHSSVSQHMIPLVLNHMQLN